MNKPVIADRQPDSGKPTVRDERGACGNVSYGMGYTGTSSGNAETDKPMPKVARVVFLPDFLKARVEGISGSGRAADGPVRLGEGPGAIANQYSAVSLRSR